MAPTISYGEMLQTLRKIRGISQVEFAERAGISQPLLSFYESGKREISLSMGAKFAGILDVHPSLFMAAEVWADYTETLRQAEESLLRRIDRVGKSTPESGGDLSNYSQIGYAQARDVTVRELAAASL